MYFISVLYKEKNKQYSRNSRNKHDGRTHNLKKSVFCTVVFHCFIIILVTSRKRFIVVKMTFNLKNNIKKANETCIAYDTHVMHVYLNNVCFFLFNYFSPTTDN